MSQSFDPHAAPPPGLPPPGSAGPPPGSPSTEVPAYGAPPPGAMPVGYDVPAYGAPPPMSGGHREHPDRTAAGVLASFGSRLGAWLLDGLITTVISLALLAPIGWIVLDRFETTSEPCIENGQSTICEVATDASLRLVVIAIILSLVLPLLVILLYHVRPISKSGQTPGRKRFGIKVVSGMTGEPPSFGKALLRQVFAGLGAIPCWLGFLWMLWDSQNQTWHDKVASTVVVRA